MNTSPDIRVRLAIPSDALALARLRYEFRASRRPLVEEESAFVARCTSRMERVIADDEHWRAWVLDHAGTLVGNVWLQLIDKLPNPGAELERHGYLTSFYVRAALRGAGLGSRLLDALVAACGELGVDTVFLWPTDRSRPLYERRGFRVSANILSRALSGDGPGDPVGDAQASTTLHQTSQHS
jgi:GNAT superfamily N-acetyltransferase